MNTPTENRYQYNGKELEKDLGINLYDYGARWYDAAVGRFATTDPRATDYAFQSPYAYAVDNPVGLRDILGMGVETIIVGKQEWSPGEKYKGNDEFGKKMFSILEEINSTKAGSKMLGRLVSSNNNYVLAESVGAKGVAGKFLPNEVGILSKGGKILVAQGQSKFSTISHELFHAYQYDKKGYLHASTSAEVGAYLFESVVALQSGGAAFTISSTKNGENFDSSFSKLLFEGFDMRDYFTAILTFKDSSHNANGKYNNVPIDIDLTKSPPIKEFLPAFK